METFPHFTTLSIDDSELFAAAVDRFDPYAEFSFPCVFAWSGAHSIRASVLNDNLVIEFRDYESYLPVLSVMGDTAIDETLSELLRHVSELRLVPEPVVASIELKSRFRVIADRANFDYVYDIPSYLVQGPSRRRLQQIRQFERLRSSDTLVTELDLTNQLDVERVVRLFDRWAASRDRDVRQVAHERAAITKLLANASCLKVGGVMLEIGGEDAGFSLFDIVHRNYGIVRFHKADPAVPHADAYLSDYMFRYLADRGCSLVSWEQDLGIHGLRCFKESFRPNAFLKKFTIRRPPGPQRLQPST